MRFAPLDNFLFGTRLSILERAKREPVLWSEMENKDPKGMRIEVWGVAAARVRKDSIELY